MRYIGLLIVLACVGLSPGKASAQVNQGCFTGLDATHQPAWMALSAERYGDYYEISGQVASTSFGVFRIKADGWSGAGRMFRRHEGEADALYIKISDYTGSGLVLHIEGFGSFPFQAVPC